MPRKVLAGSKCTTRSVTLARRDPFAALSKQLKSSGTPKLVTRQTSAQRKMVKDLMPGPTDQQVDTVVRGLAEGKKDPALVGNDKVANRTASISRATCASGSGARTRPNPAPSAAT